jgi:hypothetical protein
MRKLLAVLGMSGLLVGGGASADQETATVGATCTLNVRGMT